MRDRTESTDVLVVGGGTAGFGAAVAAGRIISADPVAFASIRGMPQCMAMGQATGTAAALALRDGVAVQDVDTDRLVAALAAQGINRIGTPDQTADVA